MTTFGIHVANTGVADLVAMAHRAEAAGVPTLWLTSGLGPDSLTSLAVVGAHTERIHLGSAIAIAYSRHPLAMIQQARAIEDVAPGRLRLGVGTSHKATIENMWGLSFDRPLSFLREYLEVLRQARTGELDFEGTRLSVHAKLQAPVTVPLLISALRRTAYRLAGELADGAIAWVTPTAFLRDVAGPALRESATAHGRPRPALVGHVFALVTSDPTAAHANGLERLAGYGRMPFYAAMFRDAGYPDTAAGDLPTALVHDLVLVGSEERVTEGLRRFADAGCDEVIVSLLPGTDADVDRTLALLGRLVVTRSSASELVREGRDEQDARWDARLGMTNDDAR
jgi:F420-dependent oxidoreductase-like protein